MCLVAATSLPSIGPAGVRARQITIVIIILTKRVSNGGTGRSERGSRGRPGRRCRVARRDHRRTRRFRRRVRDRDHGRPQRAADLRRARSDVRGTPASAPDYEEFRWEITLTNTAGETVEADEIVVSLDHGEQRVTGTLDRSLRPGESVGLTVVHNNQDGDTIPGDVNCTDVNVACRLAGDDGNYPDADRIRLQMVHEPSGSILYRKQIGIAGSYGIFNGNPDDIDITDETLTFA